jgi:hypothetical protein
MDFKNKYLKYKTKYLNAKYSLFGGAAAAAPVEQTIHIIQLIPDDGELDFNTTVDNFAASLVRVLNTAGRRYTPGIILLNKNNPYSDGLFTFEPFDVGTGYNQRRCQLVPIEGNSYVLTIDQTIQSMEVTYMEGYGIFTQDNNVFTFRKFVEGRDDDIMSEFDDFARSTYVVSLNGFSYPNTRARYGSLSRRGYQER